MTRILSTFLCCAGLGLAQQAEAATYTFDQSASSVTFHNSASLHEIDGVVKTFSGTFDSDAGTGELKVQAASLTTNLGPRDSKMHSFCLESSNFPGIAFKVTGVEGGEVMNSGAKKGRVKLKGDLTIRDVTKSVVVSSSFTRVGDDLQLNGKYAFKWGDYNVADPSIIISTLYPDMSVGFRLVLKPVAQ
jgi:polyisoprenoid-binding protein YceI